MMEFLADKDLILEFFINSDGDEKYADKFLTMVESQKLQMFITDRSLHKISSYLSKIDDQLGEKIISRLQDRFKCKIITVTEELIKQADKYSFIGKEPAIEVVCAKSRKLNVIVTQSPDNYSEADLKVLSIQDFLEPVNPKNSGTGISFLIPTPLQKFTNNQATIQCTGGTVEELIDSLENNCPGIKARICDETGKPRRFLNIYVNSEDILFLNGMDTALNDGDEVSIVPAVAGG